jgi:hypothetical protein
MLNAKSHRPLVAAISLAIVVIAMHLLPGMDKSAIQQEVRNALHVVGFAVVAAIMFQFLLANIAKSAVVSPNTNLLIAFVLTAAIAGLAEFSQAMAGKNFDPEDLARDLGGAVLYLLGRFLWDRSSSPDRSTAARYSLRSLSGLAAGLVFAPLCYIIFMNASIAARFPTILDFDGGWDTRFSFPVYAQIKTVAADPSFVEFDGQVAEIQLLRPDWSGIRIESVVSDWSDYQHMVLSARLVNGADNSRLSVHLSDGDHVGVRSQHAIGGAILAGATMGEQSSTIRIALEGIVDLPTRPDLDISNIEQVYIICHGRHDGAVLFIDNIHLE